MTLNFALFSKYHDYSHKASKFILRSIYSMALRAALYLIVIMVSCFGDSIKLWPYCLFPFFLVVSPLSNFANVYDVGNIPLSFLKKIKIKNKKTHVNMKFWVGTELLLSAAPFWKKKGREGGWTRFFFLFDFSFITHHYHYYGTIMPNCQPQLTFPQQEKTYTMLLYSWSQQQRPQTFHQKENYITLLYC